MKWGLKGGISIDADSGPPRYVLWCCGGIYHQLLTFFQIGCDHTVRFISYSCFVPDEQFYRNFGWFLILSIDEIKIILIKSQLYMIFLGRTNHLTWRVKFYHCSTRTRTLCFIEIFMRAMQLTYMLRNSKKFLMKTWDVITNL